MKKWSYWAKVHPLKARWIIVLATILLITLGLEVGFGLAAWNIEIPHFFILLLCLLLFLLTCSLPKKTNYVVSRRIHFALCIGAFVGAAFFGNLFMFQVEKMQELTPVIASNSLVHPVSQKAPALEKNPKNIMAIGLLEMKLVKNRTKALKEKVKKLRERYRELPRGVAFLLFLLASMGAAALAYLITALACYFACSNVGVLAVLFIIIAVAFALGSLFLLGYAFYRLFEGISSANSTSSTPRSTEKPKG